jgi:uncharacterized protein (DUF2236 family)
MVRTTTSPLMLPWPLQGRLEAAVAALYRPPDGMAVDFASPAGEAALAAPDSLSWLVFKNPVTMFIGGVAAVILELAEPRVRSGVWEHTSFRTEPLQRMRRTALATAVTVYGPRSRAEALIARVSQLHARVQGATPEGTPYRADDPQLLDWVQATAAYGFLEAWCAYVRPLSPAERDRFYAEGQPAARLYGALHAPGSQAELAALFDAMRDRLQPSAIVGEFLRIVGDMPALPPPLRPMQRVYIRAAVAILPPWLRERLALEADWSLAPWQRVLASGSARAADRLLLRSSPAVQSCRRLGLPEDWLYRPRQIHGVAPAQ